MLAMALCLSSNTWSPPSSSRKPMRCHISSTSGRGQRDAKAFGVIWIDLDHFKLINDRFGHDIGDKALVTVAKQIRAILRGYDEAARWGGDEFLILIRDATPNLIEELTARLLSQVNQFKPEVPQLKLSLSAGACVALREESLQMTLARADKALYRAKEEGRNCYRLD